MKKTILIGLCILVILLVAGSYKPLMYRIFNDYEEVCVRYQQNVTAKCKAQSFIGSYDYYVNWGRCIKEKNDTFVLDVYYAEHNYIQTDNCIEYGLRRKTDIEPFIYLFDWCKVYPDSEECS